VLVSTLATRVQPVLRYDLGDSILRRLDPCPRVTPCLRSALSAAPRTCSRSRLPTNKPVIVELPVLSLGAYEFKCRMNMTKGLLVVSAGSSAPRERWGPAAAMMPTARLFDRGAAHSTDAATRPPAWPSWKYKGDRLQLAHAHRIRFVGVLCDSADFATESAPIVMGLRLRKRSCPAEFLQTRILKIRQKATVRKPIPP